MREAYIISTSRKEREYPKIGERAYARSPIFGPLPAISWSTDYYLDGVALNLHGFYSGLERVFTLIAETVDGSVPQGENWHLLLLQQMTGEISNVRPAVISEAVTRDLNEYRGFRHVVRNVYTYHFDPIKIEKLVHKVPDLFMQLKLELSAFANFLEQKF